MWVTVTAARLLRAALATQWDSGAGTVGVGVPIWGEGGAPGALGVVIFVWARGAGEEKMGPVGVEGCCCCC